MLGPDDVVADEPAVGEGRRLADVVQERRQPEMRRVAGPAPSTDRSVWSHRSSPGTLFWGMPRWAASSGEIPASRPVSASRRRPIDGRSARRGASRARPRCARRTGAGRARRRAWIPASVAGSIDDSSVAASRTARIIRRASSSKRTRGSPTARIVGPSRSARPSNGIDQRRRRAARRAARRAPGHRVDREVATREVELDRYRRTRRDADAGSRRSRGRSGTS